MTRNWFSNMLPFDAPLVYQGITYRTVENFYQAMKTRKDDLVTRRKIADANPYKAKRLGRRIVLRPDWMEIRLEVMEYALRWKFALGTSWHRRLIATVGAIIEWNDWGDQFWGRDAETKVGENHLGLLLMKLRDEWSRSTVHNYEMNTHQAPPAAVEDYLNIQGLIYIPRFLSPDQQDIVLAEIDREPWSNELRRRVQHYGYKYDYRQRAINHSMRAGTLPPFAIEVAQRLMVYDQVTEFPDQAIVNEYLPGQGISAHVDCEPCFKNTIITISLGAAYEMDFLKSRDIRSTMLEPGSALVLQGVARYQWMHRIQGRTSDHGILRGRRVSLTFRNVILNS